jgi:hypothetical protein
MKYAAEMGSGAMIYIPSFINTGSGIQKVNWGDIQTAWWCHKPTYLWKKIAMGVIKIITNKHDGFSMTDNKTNTDISLELVLKSNR